VPLLAEDTEEAVEIAKEILETYATQYEHAWLSGMRAKCGLVEKLDHTDDKALLEELLDIMAANNADFTLTFFYLSQLNIESTEADDALYNMALRNLYDNPDELDDWLIQWRTRLGEESLSDHERQARMQAVNPVYIPRNHQIETAIRAAEDHSDFSLFHDLHGVLQNPYQQQAGKDHYMLTPEPHEIVTQTFCGT
jgi:uncharacterized protein YdiU (UPF0061 family)